jgi:hypothetical protein
MRAVSRHPARPLPRVFCLSLLVVSLLATPQARARTAGHHARGLSATCKIHVINGLNVPGKFPASLRHLKRRLKAQPFKVFLSFKLLRVTSMKLATGRIARAKLAGPYRLEGQLISQIIVARRKRRLRFVLALYRRRTRLHAAKRMVKTTLVLDRGGTFFFVGPPHKGGKLVIGMTCK